MDDATPSATRIPAQPVATVTSIEAPFPPPDPLLAVFVPPAVTDPVSNLGFLPVDDAFALEMRAQSIEQLVGGDALRRGESERIEAGRSQANADRVAGRDRARVQGSLHEHTGHALAEQAAHLHTTVEGALVVHAAGEDTVLLAGHMSELWDGGAAIVAAMTDDTVAGGGIRVTTPLDLWVHAVMGVEERIGTCTADAVLMELGATHYEREYGPGAHAAGLAAYTGSLHQSSRSTFRPLMRVSSGVRNLIAGGGGDGGGGDAGAGDAPAASPAPAPATGGAGTRAASETLGAATGAGGTAQAGGMAGVRSQDLTGIHRVDDVATLARGANVARASGDLTGLRRGTDTAGQLAALHDAMRGTEAGAQGEVRSTSRVSKPDDTASVHEACAPDIVAHIRSGATVPGMDAPVLHSTVSPPQPPPGVKLGLLGGADRPPRPAPPARDFLAVYRRLLDRRRYYSRLSRTDVVHDFQRAMNRVSESIRHLIGRFGGHLNELAARPPSITQAEHGYFVLQEMAREAEWGNDSTRAAEIRDSLGAIHGLAVEQLRLLSTRHRLAEAPSTQAMQRPPTTVRPTVAAAVIPPVTVMPPVTGGAAQVPIGSPDQSLIGHLAHVPSVPGLPPTSSLPGPPLAQAAGAEAGVLGRWRLDRPTTFSGTTAAHPAITETIVTHSLAEASAFWLQPANPMLTPGSVPFDSGLHRAGETVQPPPVTTTARSTAPGARSHAPSWTDENLAIERALLADRLPPGFDASRLVDVARRLGEPVLAEELAEGRLPVRAIDLLIDVHRANSQSDPNTLIIGKLSFLKESIERALRDEYLWRVDQEWLDCVRDMELAPGSVAFDSGLHHAGDTVQPPPVTTTASGTAPAHGAPSHVPSPLDDGFAIERAVLAGKLPPGFDASRLVDLARGLGEHVHAEELAEGGLPVRAIGLMIYGFRTTDVWDRNTPIIGNLSSLKESIERALRDEYLWRVDQVWLDYVRDMELPPRRSRRAAPSAASATGLPVLDLAQIDYILTMDEGFPELDATEIDRLLGTGAGVSYPAPPPPPSAPGHAGAGAGAPPTAAGPWRSRPPGMGGAPLPVAFDPWSALPGPGSRARHTEAMRTAVMSAGAPPGWQGAETHGFARAASGDFELPFSQREGIAHRFGTEDALIEAERTLQTGGAGRARLVRHAVARGARRPPSVSAPSSSRTPRPPRPGSASTTGARLRSWPAFSMTCLLHRETAQSCPFTNHSSEART